MPLRIDARRRATESSGTRGVTHGGAASSSLADDEASTPHALFQSHFSFVWRNLRRLGVPEAAAEDATQDVFLVVHRRFHTYDARWASVDTWLFGITLRVARDYRRSARRRDNRIAAGVDVESALQRTHAPDTTPDEVAARREATAMLERVLAQLDARKRAVLVMVDFEQLSVPEAAQALNVNINTAYWRLRSARVLFERAVVRVCGSKPQPWEAS